MRIDEERTLRRAEELAEPRTHALCVTGSGRDARPLAGATALETVDEQRRVDDHDLGEGKRTENRAASRRAELNQERLAAVGDGVGEQWHRDRLRCFVG